MSSNGHREPPLTDPAWEKREAEDTAAWVKSITDHLADAGLTIVPARRRATPPHAFTPTADPKRPHKCARCAWPANDAVHKMIVKAAA